MDRRLTFGLATAAIAAALCAVALRVHSQDTAPRVLVATRDGELTAEAPGAAWCTEDMTFTVRAQDERFLNGGEVDAQGRHGRMTLQKLLGGLRARLERECPQARAITLNGFVDDVFIYRGQASRADTTGNWPLHEVPVVLVATPPEPPPPLPSKVAQSAPPQPRQAAVGECDALAAHPDDPKRPKGIAGVSDDDMQPGPARAACEEALAFAPGDTRLKFQLARALISYDKIAEGLELMTDAAEEGHGAAVATLADITLYGLLDETPDPATAKALYQKAAKLGFQPAVALAAAIEADPKEDTSQQQVAAPQFHHPDRMATVLKGEALTGVGYGQAFLQSLAYSSRVLVGMAYQCYSKGIDAVLVLSGVQNKSQAMNALSDIDGGFFVELQQAGMDDGYAVVQAEGCDSPKVEAAKETVRRTLYAGVLR